MKYSKVKFQRLTLLISIAAATVFIIFSVYLFLYSDESFRMIIALICAFSLVLPRLLYHHSKWRYYISLKKTAIIEFILVLMLSLNGIGALGFYLSITYYDMVLHASAPIGAAVVLYLMVNSVLDKKGKYTFLRGQGLVLAMTTVGIFLWEGWEYYGDLIFGTMMRGQPGEPLDTTYDILAGICSLTVIYIINTYIHKRYFKNKIRV